MAVAGVLGRWIRGEKVRLDTKLMVLLEMVEGSVDRRADGNY